MILCVILLIVTCYITPERIAEQLKLDNENLKFENKMQGLKLKVEEQTKFIEVINQINHDIMSPLASLKILTHVFAKFLPEEQCETYVRAIQRLAEIAGSMLNYFRFDNHLQIEDRELLLVSVELISAIAAKKYEYSANKIEFNIHVANSFSCLSVGMLGFNRMISNIINNAVDAKASTIDIELARVKNEAQIIIEDNGCGMAENVKNKILASIAVTEGKAHGLGIGYSQISQALTQNDGKLHIDSKVGLGTKVTIILPITPTPKWLASKIIVKPDDTVVVFTTKDLVKTRWMTKLKDGQTKYFDSLKGIAYFVESLNAEQKKKLIVIVDEELLDCSFDGIYVIGYLGIKRSMLLTHQYNKIALQGTKFSIIAQQLFSKLKIIYK